MPKNPAWKCNPYCVMERRYSRENNDLHFHFQKSAAASVWGCAVVHYRQWLYLRANHSQRWYALAMPELATTRKTIAERGKRLEYFTIVWNSLEGLVAVIAGAIAGSISLVGFGIDSFIEVTSGATLLWRISVDADWEGRERNERLSIRIVGVCFITLAVYVAYEAVSDLFGRNAPEHSITGIVLACVSLIVMPILSRAKKKVGRDLGSIAMEADAKQTDFCVYLSAILLVGLLLNAAFGWWWADPVAALVMVPILAKEGVEGVKGKTCCDPHNCD
jgi:divalent metal cation (Fe/Co/Zn/Cd) transporter